MHIIQVGEKSAWRTSEPRQRALAAEARVAEELGRFLDDRHYLLRDVTLPGEQYDLDMVLVGPRGVWEFEIIFFERLLRDPALGWLHWDHELQAMQPVPPELAPRTQAKMESLRRYLSQQGLPELDVNQANILAMPNAPRDFSLPGLEVVFVEQVRGFVTKALELFQPRAPAPVAQIVRALNNGRLPSATLSAEQRLIITLLAAGLVLLALLFVGVFLYYQFF